MCINQSLRQRKIDKPSIKLQAPNLKVAKHHISRTIQNYTNFRHRPVTTSTPIPRKFNEETPKVYFDQSTQTDETSSLDVSQMVKVEEMEMIIRKLYNRFQSLVNQANVNKVSHSLSALTQKTGDGDESYHARIPAEACSVQSSELLHVEKPATLKQETVNVTEQAIKSSAVPGDKNDFSNSVQVRRMSAQTTNNVEGASSNDADMVIYANDNVTSPGSVIWILEGICFGVLNNNHPSREIRCNMTT